jgi:predicted TIM-barrel fold metal-dependent hydrolase
MDQEGVDVAVGFPTNCQLLGSAVWAKDPALHAAMVTAYNNWAIDYCKNSGGRVRAIAHASPKDPQGGVGEVHRMASSPEVVGLFHPSMEVDNSWGDPRYEPLWSALEETYLPVCWHGSASHPLAQSFVPINDKYPSLSHALMHPVGAMLALGGMIFGGVLEKHPKLKAAFYESNAGWLPFWLARLDDHTEGRQGVFVASEHEGLLKKRGLLPSEYFHRQCFIACDADEGTLGLVTGYLDGERIIFNTDYPHPDAPFPGAVEKFLKQPISEEHKRKILWDNGISLYGPHLLNEK